MCDRCNEFCTRFYVDGDREYHDLVRQLVDFVERGVFKVVSADIPLSEILRSHVRPADDLIHVFVCPHCGRTFKFSSSYHSDKALWEVLIPNPPPRVQ
jgi:hypothetical protein